MRKQLSSSHQHRSQTFIRSFFRYWNKNCLLQILKKKGLCPLETLLDVSQCSVQMSKSVTVWCWWCSMAGPGPYLWQLWQCDESSNTVTPHSNQSQPGCHTGQPMRPGMCGLHVMLTTFIWNRNDFWKFIQVGNVLIMMFGNNSHYFGDLSFINWVIKILFMSSSCKRII